MSYESTQKYSNVASAVPVVLFWNLADESFVVKNIPLFIKVAQ